MPGLNVTTFFEGTIHLVAGPRVPRLARGPPLDLEDAEIPQLDPPLGDQRLDDRVERPLDDVLGLELRQADLLGDLLDDLFLGHDGGLPRGTIGPCRTSIGSTVLVAWSRVKPKVKLRLSRPWFSPFPEGMVKLGHHG